MYKIAIVLLVFFFPYLAHGAMCDAGYWLNNGICEMCETMGNSSYYCPGDDMLYTCPDVEDNTYFSNLWTWTSNGLASTVAACRATFVVQQEHGKIRFSCSYDGGSYFTKGTYKCMVHSDSYCDPGYYKIVTNNNDNYFIYKDNSYEETLAYTHCVAVGHGYYYSGTGVRIKCPNGTYTNTNTSESSADCLTCTNTPEHAHYTDTDTTGINNCPWECDAGYGRHGDECLPLCVAGMTKLNTSNGLSYNIYRDKITTPALNILRNNTVCYVNLESGTATGAINIQHGNMVYHVTD